MALANSETRLILGKKVLMTIPIPLKKLKSLKYSLIGMVLNAFDDAVIAKMVINKNKYACILSAKMRKELTRL